jgi:hypothetical protein
MSKQGIELTKSVRLSLFVELNGLFMHVFYHLIA